MNAGENIQSPPFNLGIKSGYFVVDEEENDHHLLYYYFPSGLLTWWSLSCFIFLQSINVAINLYITDWGFVSNLYKMTLQNPALDLTRCQA